MLEDLSRWLCERYGAHAVFVYGSAVDGPSEKSDIDVIALWDRSQQRAIQTTYAGFDVDLLLTFPGAIQRALAIENPPVIRALGTGRLTMDAKGMFAPLLEKGGRAWASGPRSCSDLQRRLIHSRCRKIQVVTLRARRHVGSTDFDERMMDLRACTMLDMLTTDYCRLSKLWTSSFRDLLSTQDEAYRALQEHLGRFLRAESTEGRLDALEGFARSMLVQAVPTLIGGNS